MKKIFKLAAVPLLFYFFAYIMLLGARPMGAPDEFRYGQIPREMLQTGNFIAPQMFGHPYFEKPVLGYWLIAASEYLFGFNAFAVRLPMALCTGLTALMLFLAVRKYSGNTETAKYSAMFYLASGLVMSTGVIAVLDPILAAFTTAMCITVFFALEEQNSTVKKLFLLAICGIAAGLVFLTKGPIGWIFPGFAALGYIVWNRRWKELFILPLPILLFCLITIAPWAIAVHRADADFWRYFIEVEHIQRFTSDAGGQHSQPFWYFVPVMICGILPGAFALPGVFKLSGKSTKEALKNNGIRFSLCGVILPFLFLSCSNGKLLTYLLPSFPMVGVLLGTLFMRQLQDEKAAAVAEKVPLYASHFFAVAGITAAVCAIGNFLPKEYFVFLASAALVFLAGVIVQKKYQKRPLETRFDVLALSVAIIAGVIGSAIPSRLNTGKFPGECIEKIRKQLPVTGNPLQLVSNTVYMHAMVWQFNNTDLVIIGRKGEHDYAIDRYAAEGKEPFYFMYNQLHDIIKRAKSAGKDVVVFYDSSRQYRFIPWKLPELEFEVPKFNVAREPDWIYAPWYFKPRKFSFYEYTPDKTINIDGHTADLYISGNSTK